MPNRRNLMLSVLACAALAAFAQDAPKRAPKPKNRIRLLQQMQADLDKASPAAKVDEKGRKKLDKCHETLIDAIAQQQRYKSVNKSKVNGCMNDLDKLDDAGAFPEADRATLRKDREDLEESVGKAKLLRLPKPL
jgi:hypothetical protein